MNWLKKLISKLFGFDDVIDNLTKLNNLYRNESKKVIYCHIEQPTGDFIDQFNEDIGKLATNKNFAFMLDAMEGFLLNDLKTAKQGDIGVTAIRINGALQMLDCIRKTAINASEVHRDTESEESDIILNNMNAMFNASKN